MMENRLWCAECCRSKEVGDANADSNNLDLLARESATTTLNYDNDKHVALIFQRKLSLLLTQISTLLLMQMMMIQHPGIRVGAQKDRQMPKRETMQCK